MTNSNFIFEFSVFVENRFKHFQHGLKGNDYICGRPEKGQMSLQKVFEISDILHCQALQSALFKLTFLFKKIRFSRKFY